MATANGGAVRDPQRWFSERLRGAVSELLGRARFADRVGSSFGGKRNVQKVLGYKRNLVFKDYLHKYLRQDVAAKIIDIPAEDTWRKQPTLIDGEQASDQTGLSRAFMDLVKRHRLFHHLQKVDRLTGLGRYGVLLIGLEGDGNLAEPVKSGDARQLAYLRTYSERRAEITQMDMDVQSPRFGFPELYRLTAVSDPQSLTRFVTVHHSRILHVAENTMEDEVYGTPRLERVYDRLDDILKVVGGSAEIFWLLAARILHVDIDKDYEIDDAVMEALDDKLLEIQHDLRRTLQTQGAKVSSIGGQVVDPRGSFEVQKLLLAAATGIPLRILFGSEQGQLASSQDLEQWRGKVAGRQSGFAEPVILRPLVDRLVEFGVLPGSTEEYRIDWPPLFELGPTAVAERAAVAARAVSQFAPGAAQAVIPLHEFRKEYLGLASVPPDMPEGMSGDVATVLEELQQLREEVDALRAQPPSPPGEE